MINKIIFRAKIKSGPSAGSWVYWNVYGELCTENGKRHPLKIEMPRSVSQYYNVVQIQSIIDKKTIGQYTGRCDVSGSKVFTGDILNILAYEHNNIGVIVFDTHDQATIIKKSAESIIHITDFGNLGRPDYYKIVGNIFDNPELLEGKQ